MAPSDRRVVIVILLLSCVLISGFVAGVLQTVNASGIDLWIEPIGFTGLPPNTIYAGYNFHLFFRVNVQYTGTASGTLGYSTCQSCPSIWEAHYGGIDSGDVVETERDPIYNVGSYVAFLKMIIPGPGGGAVVAGYANFQVIPMVTTTTSASGSATDWAITSVSLSPPDPHLGDPVTFSMAVMALSSVGSFPQQFAAACQIDGVSCGGGSLTYPGPLGTPMTVSTQTTWIATAGTHTLTWGVATIPVGQDPNKSNNMKSITFTVAQASSQQTTTASSTYSTASQIPDFQINVSPPSQTVLQGETTSYAVNVAGLNGFNSQVSLSLSGLPSGANGGFSNPSGAPDFASTLTVVLSGDVATGSYTLTVTGSGGGLSHVANLVLTVNAAVVTQSSASSTETSASSTQTSSDLMSLIQQNQLLILAAVVLLAAVLIAVALRGGRKPTST
ncbi:MAG: hypothetical protein ABSF00_13250 [Candidatus Bathyarchaeia archaeon]